MSEFRARIGDIGPSSAPNGRARAQYHYVAENYMRKYPFERQPGESLCNPNLDRLEAAPADVTEATCTKCVVRADRYGVRIVTTPTDTDTTTPDATSDR